MSRTIKLRAWDCKARTFVPLTSLMQLTDPGLIVSEFSGVYDVDGREIWEGDITQWSYFDDEEQESGTCFYVCEFRNGCFGFYMPDQREFVPFESTSQHSQVISTIYQRPDLPTQIRGLLRNSVELPLHYLTGSN